MKKKSGGSGLKGPHMPKAHFEKHESQVMSCDEKYATEFGNPADLQKNADALASYAKKNKMKY